MVARFAEHLVDQFEKEKLMDHTMREHYIYAVVSIIERFFYDLLFFLTKKNWRISCKALLAMLYYDNNCVHDSYVFVSSCAGSGLFDMDSARNISCGYQRYRHSKSSKS